MTVKKSLYRSHPTSDRHGRHSLMSETCQYNAPGLSKSAHESWSINLNKISAYTSNIVLLQSATIYYNDVIMTTTDYDFKSNILSSTESRLDLFDIHINMIHRPIFSNEENYHNMNMISYS